MKNVLSFCLSFFIAVSAFSQTIPQNRLVDWSLAGNKRAFKAPQKVVDFSKNGGVNNGTTPNDVSFQAMLTSLKGDSAIIYLPNGRYLFTRPITLTKNLILRGENSDSTVLLFNLSKPDQLIKVQGVLTGTGSPILNNVFKDSIRIRVAEPQKFAAGDFIKIAENDSVLITSGWAYQSTGQIVQIQRITGQYLRLSSPLRRNFHISKGAKILKVEPVQNVGIENLKIERQDATTQQTSNIYLRFAANCWVKCVESFKANFSHIELSNSTNLEITGNYIHHAFEYGSGGKGYGVLVHYTSGENLIKDNIFNNLRHSMLLQAGANGNVLAYNYSINPYWNQSFFPTNSAGDLVLHGNYVYANLFEGNVVQNIVIDNSHGKNGPGNTFFRNRAELYGFIMNANAGDSMLYIGNEITNNSNTMGNFSLTGNGHFQYGNNRRGTIIPDGTGGLPKASLYLDKRPVYYINHSSWPPVGPPNDLKEYTIQAEAFYNNGTYTPCGLKIPIDTTEDTSSSIILDHNFGAAPVNVYPNPANDFVKIFLTENSVLKVAEITVYNSAGKEISVVSNTNVIAVKTLNSGLYLLRIRFSDNTVVMKKIVKNSN